AEVPVPMEPAADAAPAEAAVVPAQRSADSGHAAAPADAATAAPDDLRRIEGVGPKMAAALNAAGIHTYAQLAAADESAVRAAISAAGLRSAPSLVTWPRQARLLAEAGQGEVADPAGRLVGGRDTGRNGS
ncbi:MAG TPA: helix-hairpin-helix domain-containing protein, partial [Actinoplanes sp.]|nr:helix-hairpin-helix domain-containing protein [Actinoplanes sp.]